MSKRFLTPYRMLVLTVFGPSVLAGLVTWFVFALGPLSREPSGWDGAWEVFWSYAIMFNIATWVPVFLMVLISMTRHVDAGPDGEQGD